MYVCVCVLAVLHWANGAVGQQVSLSEIVSSVMHTLTQTRANMHAARALSHYLGPWHRYHDTPAWLLV